MNGECGRTRSLSTATASRARHSFGLKLCIKVVVLSSNEDSGFLSFILMLLLIQMDLGIVARMSFSFAAVRATSDHPFTSETILGENDPPESYILEFHLYE